MNKKMFSKLWESFDIIPCFKDVMLDMATVPTLLEGFSEKPMFLLESASFRDGFSRFTYFGIPKKIFFPRGNPFSFIKNLVNLRAPAVSELGNFSGGVVFLLGYGASNHTGLLRSPIRKGKDLAVAMLVDSFLVLDNRTQRLRLCLLKKRGRTWDEDYAEAVEELDAMEEGLKRAVRKGLEAELSERRHEVSDVWWEMDGRRFMELASEVRGLIELGEAIQVVLSQKVELHGSLDPIRFYRLLRRINPSPYMFFLKTGKNTVFCGSSPEVHLKVTEGKAVMKPIAGTYPVGPDIEATIKALREDEKERAEHLMLVDLARNDLYTHCLPESVKVPVFMEPEVYSHVVHLVSLVEGDLPESVHPVDLLRATFPAGTVSGAPKVRAMEIIDGLEASPRDFYAGCVGYYSYNGNLDTCITIRSARFSGNNRCVLRAGAGIVYDSIPEREHQEIQNKLKALTVAMESLGSMRV